MAAKSRSTHMDGAPEEHRCDSGVVRRTSHERLSVDACVASYIQRTYKRQDGRKDASLKRCVLGAYNQGLPGKEVGLGDGAFPSELRGQSRAPVSAPYGIYLGCKTWSIPAVNIPSGAPAADPYPTMSLSIRLPCHSQYWMIRHTLRGKLLVLGHEAA